MATEDKPIDVRHYLEIGLRRKWYIIVPLFFSVGISFCVYQGLPKVYRASALIVAQPQRISEHLARPMMKDMDSVTNQLNTITHESLNQTHLEKVIQELNLYADLRSSASMEGIVEIMRRAIEVKIEGKMQYGQSQNYFSISYEGRDPKEVMTVANKLTSLFIEENQKDREQQAKRTSDFLVKELEALEDALKKKEQAIRHLKEDNMGQLPDQLEANLRTLERLQQQLQTTSENIRTAEDRAILLRSQIEQILERERKHTSRIVRQDPVSETEKVAADDGPEDSLITQYKELKRELAVAQSKYTASHPDVIDLKKKIAKLEPKVTELLENQKIQREVQIAELKSSRDSAGTNSLSLRLSSPILESTLANYADQYNEAQLETRRLKAEEKNLKEQIASYRKRVEETPRWEQELAVLTRNYDLMKANYQSLLDKKVEAEMSENLERGQQSDRFKVVDPARIPLRPARPNLMKILLGGLLFGFVSGIVLAWFRESFDESFHTVSEVEGYLQLPVIATIPNLEEEEKKAA
jgi:polysaccharide chain length determinant protein (PEP-CTERM system associated)